MGSGYTHPTFASAEKQINICFTNCHNFYSKEERDYIFILWVFTVLF